MRPIHLIILAVTFNLNTVVKANSDKIIHRIETATYQQEKSTNKIVIPVNFAEALLISKATLSELDINEVYQIDLVYTQFKSSPSFNQEALNQDRIEQLEKQIPQINKDLPNWNFIEQTKAKDRATANSYFHGFVIYYREKAPSYATQKELFAPYREEITTTFTVNNESGSDLDYSSGSQIHIPANAVTYANGDLVKGDFTVEYTEYRNSADIAFSGIPMKFDNGDENLSFSSIGMYEIRGFQNGQELALQKPITIDFNCTKKVTDASYYELDEATQEWKELAPIASSDFGKDLTKNNTEQEIVDTAVDENITTEKSKSSYLYPYFTLGIHNAFGKKIQATYTKDEIVTLDLNRRAWKAFEKLKGTESIDTLFYTFNETERTIKTNVKCQNTLCSSIANDTYTFVDIPKINRTKTSFVMSYPGHSFPNLVTGLSAEGFGVYNCDQVRRIKNRKTMTPVYSDATTGKLLDAPFVACLLDLKYINSFSFNPGNVTYNVNGRNALLITTANKRSYLILPSAFAKATKEDNKHPELSMIDITDEVKNSKELYAMLEKN